MNTQVWRFDETTRDTVLEAVLAYLAKVQESAKVRRVSEEEVRRVLEEFTVSPGEVRGYRFHGGNVSRRYRYRAETTVGEVVGWYPGVLACAFRRGYARRTAYGDTSRNEEGWVSPLEAARALRPHLVDQDLTERHRELTGTYGPLPPGVFAVVELTPPSSFRFTRPVLVAVSLSGEHLLLGPGLAVRLPRWHYSWTAWKAELILKEVWPLVRDWGQGRLAPEEAYTAFGLLDPTFLV